MKLEFDKNNVADLSLDTLRETVNENNTTGQPFNIFMHFQFIERIMKMAEEHNLQPEIQRIEAVNNKNRSMPGVSIIPFLEEKNGKGDHTTMLLRRVFTDIAFRSNETDDYVFNLAMIYHQRGVQFGIGPKVKSCKNLCIMGAEDYTSTYGKNKVENTEHMFSIMNEWFQQAGDKFKEGVDFLDSLHNVVIDVSKFKQLIGALYMKKSLNDTNRLNGTTFLKESQIAQMVDKFNKKCFDNDQKKYTDAMTGFEVYAMGTEFHRPRSIDTMNIVEGNLEFTEIFKNEIEQATILTE